MRIIAQNHVEPANCSTALQLECFGFDSVSISISISGSGSDSGAASQGCQFLDSSRASFHIVPDWAEQKQQRATSDKWRKLQGSWLGWISVYPAGSVYYGFFGSAVSVYVCLSFCPHTYVFIHICLLFWFRFSRGMTFYLCFNSLSNSTFKKIAEWYFKNLDILKI